MAKFKYIRPTEGGAQDSIVHEWKHWRFTVVRGEKTFTVECQHPFGEYLDQTTKYRKLEKAEKAIDTAILHFVRHVKAKEAAQ